MNNWSLFKPGAVMFVGVCMAFNGLAQPDTLEVQGDHVLEDFYYGNGVQWSAYPSVGISESDWERAFDRADFMRLNFVRLVVSAGDYCKTYPKGGKPVYTWENEKMKRVYKLLDYCESRNVRVLLGDWGDPAGGNEVVDPLKKQLRYDGIEEWDPRWTEIVVDLIDHLINTKGYTCIKAYNLGNEPNGYWMNCKNFGTWKTSILNLDRELISRNMRDQIEIVGPDTAWGNDWIDKTVEDDTLVKVIDAYEIHWYASNSEILSGNYGKEIRHYRNYIDANDPNGTRKSFFMGEAGMVTGKNEFDQQKNIGTFEYGVLMLNFIIQSMQGGQAGLIAWDLDDAMHPSDSEGFPDVSKMKWKEWGMWDSFAEEKGKPELAELRPWYYTWSLMSKYVPSGSSTLFVDENKEDSVRATASKMQVDGRHEYTFAIVNEGNDPKEVVLTLKNADRRTLNLKQYNYFENDMVVDSEGYPLMKQQINSVNLAEGLMIKLPSRGGVIVTSLSY